MTIDTQCPKVVRIKCNVRISLILLSELYDMVYLTARPYQPAHSADHTQSLISCDHVPPGRLPPWIVVDFLEPCHACPYLSLQRLDVGLYRISRRPSRIPTIEAGACLHHRRRDRRPCSLPYVLKLSRQAAPSCRLVGLLVNDAFNLCNTYRAPSSSRKIPL